jgi:hypothetical protein
MQQSQREVAWANSRYTQEHVKLFSSAEEIVPEMKRKKEGGGEEDAERRM